VCIAVRERGGKVLFLRKLVAGGANRSYVPGRGSGAQGAMRAAPATHLCHELYSQSPRFQGTQGPARSRWVTALALHTSRT